MSTLDLEAIKRGAETLRGGWVCAKCGSSAIQHASITASSGDCIWEPIDANPLGGTLSALVAEVERLQAAIAETLSAHHRVPDRGASYGDKDATCCSLCRLSWPCQPVRILTRESSDSRSTGSES